MSMNHFIMPFSNFHISDLYDNKCSTHYLITNKAL